MNSNRRDIRARFTPNLLRDPSACLSMAQEAPIHPRRRRRRQRRKEGRLRSCIAAKNHLDRGLRFLKRDRRGVGRLTDWAKVRPEVIICAAERDRRPLFAVFVVVVVVIHDSYLWAAAPSCFKPLLRDLHLAFFRRLRRNRRRRRRFPRCIRTQLSQSV